MSHEKAIRLNRPQTKVIIAVAIYSLIQKLSPNVSPEEIIDQINQGAIKRDTLNSLRFTRDTFDKIRLAIAEDKNQLKDPEAFFKDLINLNVIDTSGEEENWQALFQFSLKNVSFDFSKLSFFKSWTLDARNKDIALSWQGGKDEKKGKRFIQRIIDKDIMQIAPPLVSRAEEKTLQPLFQVTILEPPVPFTPIPKKAKTSRKIPRTKNSITLTAFQIRIIIILCFNKLIQEYLPNNIDADIIINDIKQKKITVSFLNSIGFTRAELDNICAKTPHFLMGRGQLRKNFFYDLRKVGVIRDTGEKRHGQRIYKLDLSERIIFNRLVYIPFFNAWDIQTDLSNNNPLLLREEGEEEAKNLIQLLLPLGPSLTYSLKHLLLPPPSPSEKHHKSSHPDSSTPNPTSKRLRKP